MFGCMDGCSSNVHRKAMQANQWSRIRRSAATLSSEAQNQKFRFFTRIKATNVEADDLRNRRMQEVEAATLQGVKRSKQYQWCGGWGKKFTAQINAICNECHLEPKCLGDIRYNEVPPLNKTEEVQLTFKVDIHYI